MVDDSLRSEFAGFLQAMGGRFIARGPQAAADVSAMDFKFGLIFEAPAAEDVPRSKRRSWGQPKRSGEDECGAGGGVSLGVAPT